MISINCVQVSGPVRMEHLQNNECSGPSGGPRNNQEPLCYEMTEGCSSKGHSFKTCPLSCPLCYGQFKELTQPAGPPPLSTHPPPLHPSHHSRIQPLQPSSSNYCSLAASSFFPWPFPLLYQAEGSLRTERQSDSPLSAHKIQ